MQMEIYTPLTKHACKGAKAELLAGHSHSESVLVKLSTGGAKCNTQHKTSESGSLNLSACVCVKVMVSVSTYLLIIACLHSTEPIL